MSRPRVVDVQHCLLATTAKRHGTHPVFDLLEVRYEQAVPPDTEFPKFIAKFDLFLRVVGRSAGPTRLRIRVSRRLRRGVWELVNDFHDPSQRLPLPRSRTVVASDSFRLPNVKLTGMGLYAVRVYFRPRVAVGTRGG